MNYKIHKNGKDYDHDYIEFNDIEFIGTPFKGSGFIGHDNRNIALTKCPMCGEENYAMSVIDGVCAWCGFDVHKIN